MGYDEETRMIEKMVSRFAVEELYPIKEEADHYPMSSFPKKQFGKLCELGVLSLTMPERYGGTGKGMNALGVVLNSISRVYASFAGIILAHAVAQQMILDGDNDDLKKGWLSVDTSTGMPPILAYPIYLDVNSCIDEISVSAKGSNYTLNGGVEFIPNLPIAKAVILTVKPDNEKKLFVLPVDSKGSEISGPVLTLGLRSNPVADLNLSEVELSRSDLIAEGQTADRLLTDTLFSFMGPVCAIASGIIEGCFNEAYEYALERYQGGKQIIDHQQMRMLLSNIRIDMESAKLAMQTLCEEAESGNSLNSARAKSMFIRALDGAARATTDGVQLLGGYGYMEDYGQARRMRDSKMVQMMLGRNDILRLDIMERHIQETR